MGCSTSWLISRMQVLSLFSFMMKELSKEFAITFIFRTFFVHQFLSPVPARHDENAGHMVLAVTAGDELYNGEIEPILVDIHLIPYYRKGAIEKVRYVKRIHSLSIYRFYESTEISSVAIFREDLRHYHI